MRRGIFNRSPTQTGSLLQRIRADSGTVTAEVAITLPLLVVVATFLLSGFQLMGLQLRLQDASAMAARSLARGEDPSAQIQRLVGSARWIKSKQRQMVCVEITGRPPALLSAVSARASSCALDKGK